MNRLVLNWIVLKWIIRVSILSCSLFFLSACPFFSVNNDADKQQSLIYLPVSEAQKKPLLGSEPFRLIDQFSTAHAINNYKDKKSIFLIYINKACFKLNEKRILNSLPSFAEPELQNSLSVPLFITKGVGETYSDYQHIKTPVLFDDFQFVTKAYGLSEVGSFVEIQMSDNQVLSRGRIPLENNTANNTVNNTNLCSVEVEDQKNSPVTFTKVRRLFASQCLYCHMTNTRYRINELNESIDYFKRMDSIQQWSKMMLKTMQTYRMPPGGGDTKLDGFPQHGRVRHEELLPLYRWLEQGASYTQEDEEILQEIRSKIQDLNKRTMSFNGRKPDFKFKMEQADEIPATGRPFSIRSPLAGPFAEDTYLEAVQFEANKNVTHHITIYLSTKKIKRETSYIQDSKMFTMPSALNFKSFSKETNAKPKVMTAELFFVNEISRNENLFFYKGNGAAFIPKGSYLSISNHYEPNGKKSKNQATILLYKYYKKELPKKIYYAFLRSNNVSLEPNQSNLEIYSVFSIKKKTQLLSIFPHTHYRGKDFKLYLKKPNSDSKLIFSAPFLIFKFSAGTRFTNSIDLNPGDELQTVTRYDNSVMNISNPDPNKKINLGVSAENNENHFVLFLLKEW